MQHTAIFHGCKNNNFQMKNCDTFLIFAKNIDCGYTLESPHCKPQFYYIKVGVKGVFVTQTCFRDEGMLTKKTFVRKQKRNIYIIAYQV